MDVGDFLSYLIEHRAPNLDSRALAGILDSLSWILEEEQARIIDTVTMEWLCGEDEYKASVAISREEVFPARSRDELVSLMEQVGEKFPTLMVKASRVIEQWDSQFGQSGTE